MVGAHGGLAGWLRRLWPGRRAVQVVGPGDLVAGRRVRIEGVARADPPVVEPLEGMPCLVASLRAWPPATTVGVDGATAHAGRAYELREEAFAPFRITVADVEIRLLPRKGRDLQAVFERLVVTYGVGVRCEVLAVPDPSPVSLVGVVRHGSARTGSPHRRVPSVVVVELETLRSLVPPVALPRGSG